MIRILGTPEEEAARKANLRNSSRECSCGLGFGCMGTPALRVMFVWESNGITRFDWRLMGR